MSTDFDAITVEDLRAVGGLKWAAFPGTIGAWVAEMDFGAAEPVTAALHAAVDRGLFGYLPTAVAKDMSAAYAGWARQRYGWDLPTRNVRAMADVLATLEMTITHFTAPGSPVILPTPAYMPFLTLPPALGREVIQVPLLLEDGRYVYDLDGVDAAFTAGAGLLILCNPHNPVGRVLERSEMEAIAGVVDAHCGRVFSDEIHAPLVYPGRTHVPYASISATTAAHTITATSASKAWNLPGLKAAQAVLSNDADRRRWAEVATWAEHGAANLGVIANTAAYTEGGPWLARVLDYLDGNRRRLGELLAERIPEIRCTEPEGTYLAWLDCRALELGDRPSEFFRAEAKVTMTDGVLCGGAGAGFARFNFAMPRPVLEQAVDQMAQALARR
ncbi:MalY/PatB family protein [Georgenia muralis]|uniref:cysteine-S-conjugate beta-lyase n=1 Tax=Georgenia muralis TaxID=154117 RepID=A0A3N5A3F1_9MICO|nr:PatB family C-S lyase [Georgenia muralis]RPF26341.1 cystathionine beta-lyase [Georgenia muralis]